MPKPRATRSLVQPFSMEDRAVYIARFAANAQMSELFNDANQRRQIAADLFNERWLDAQATVTRLDGTQFFID
jgi:hypothetical protein